MYKTCCLSSLIVIAAFSTWAFAQPPPKQASEDQMIAEAIWSLCEAFDANEPASANVAFKNVSLAYPHSAKVAYWHGRMCSHTSERIESLDAMSEMLGDLAIPSAEDDNDAIPVLKALPAISVWAQAQIGGLKKDLSASNKDLKFDASFRKAIALDPSMLAAWARLLDSPHRPTALAATDAWTKLEPENALPLYAKAILLDGRRPERFEKPVDMAVIEALELGNKRRDCKVPEEPWPTDFKIVIRANAKQDAGKPVTPKKFRRTVENMLELIHAIGESPVLSFSTFRDFGHRILVDSHKLPLEQDVRQLRAFAGVGLHLIDSNRWMYGITSGSVKRVLCRLETLAVSHGDYPCAERINELQRHVQLVSQRVGSAYRETDDDFDLGFLDLAATRVMQANRKTLEIPTIRLSSRMEPKFVVDADPTNPRTMALIDLHASSDHWAMARATEIEIDASTMKGEALAKRGYTELDEAIEQVRRSNRTERRSCGLFFVLNDPVEDNVAATCETGGYIGKSSPCIVAMHDSDSVNFFSETWSHLELRCAQILKPGLSLTQEDFNSVSPNAMYVVVPIDRIIDRVGRINPLVQSSKQRFILVAKRSDARAEKMIKHSDFVAGVIYRNLPLVVATKNEH